MGEHYTRNTVSASAWCAKCKKQTMHRVDGVKLGPCLDCIANLDAEHVRREQESRIVARQANLWGDCT